MGGVEGGEEKGERESQPDRQTETEDLTVLVKLGMPAVSCHEVNVLQPVERRHVLLI